MWQCPYQVNKCATCSGQKRRVVPQVKFEPGEAGTGFEFASEIKGGAVPKEYIPGVVKVPFSGVVFGVLCGS